MSLFDRITGREALIAEIGRLRDELRRARANLDADGSTTPGLASISGLNTKVMQLTFDGVVLYVNTTMAKALGRSKDTVIGRSIDEVDEMPWGAGDLSDLVRRGTEGDDDLEEEREYEGPDGERQIERIRVISHGDRIQILVEDITEMRNLADSFERYVPPSVIEKMKQMQQDFFRPERYAMTVLFADLRGFTSLSEKLPPEEVRLTINEYLSRMTKVIEGREATLDKFVGDEVMALFGAPIYFEDHAERAVVVALEMQEAHETLMSEWRAQEREALPVGIGINTGEMVIGNIGSRRRMEYTVLGHPVNLASRLCDRAEGGEIVIGIGTYSRLRQREAKILDLIQVQPRGRVEMRGLTSAIEAFTVTRRSPEEMSA